MNPSGGGCNADANFYQEKRSNETHESKTDGDARLARKGNGKEAKLSDMGYTVMENRNGLNVKTAASLATGKSEREIALQLLGQLIGKGKKIVGADKIMIRHSLYHIAGQWRSHAHVARNDKRWGGSAIDGRTSRHIGYKISQRTRKQVEEPFGWGKTVGLIRR